MVTIFSYLRPERVAIVKKLFDEKNIIFSISMKSFSCRQRVKASQDRDSKVSAKCLTKKRKSL